MISTLKSAQTSLPALPLPQFTKSDFESDPLSLLNNTVSAITARINALSPPNPNIRLKPQFLPQFKREDLTDAGITYFQQMTAGIINATNNLAPRNPDVKVEPVQLVQLEPRHFQEDAAPEVNRVFENIIARLNAL
jgi:hypothetical protein